MAHRPTNLMDHDLAVAAAGLVAAVALWSVQVPRAPATTMSGTWHGTSTCVNQQIDQACRDEEVIYEVDSAAGPRGPVRMVADKMVGGVRQHMGALRLRYDSVAHSWWADLSTRFRARWNFTPTGDTLTGTLTELPSGRLVRRVSARRSS